MRFQTIILAILFLTACRSSEDQVSQKYMDLKSYFAKEAIRMNGSDKWVSKTVSRNGVSESKQVKPDWAAEFRLFEESDINKPAWVDSYQIRDSGESILYTALDAKLRTRKITIAKKPDGEIKSISIVNYAKNNLYTSAEQLIYIPDSLFQISKSQDVVLMGKNEYLIRSVLSQ